jgi:hypothetical protein
MTFSELPSPAEASRKPDKPLRAGGKPASTPDHVGAGFFGIML